MIQNNRSNHGAGVYLELCSSNFNNVIIVNNDAVLSGGGIYCGISSNPLFDHTTISDNLASIGGGILSTQNSQPVFSNSILWNDFPEEVISHPDSLTITFSNIQGGWQGAGNINLDPLFCMIENGDYTLAENSPCLELGEEGFDMGALGLGCSAINLPPSEFSLLDPVNNYQIFIDMDNENQSLVFRWEISEDENGDSLVYRLYFISEEFLMDSIETSNSEIEIPFSYFIDALLLNEINSDTIIWDVSVTDSFEFISSNNGPFSFFIDIDGILSMNEDNIVPERFALHQNYPNPFNPITTIRYDLPHDSFVELIIYDLMGDMINTLVFQQESVGYKQIKWDGKNNYGLPTAAGIYFYKIQTESFMQTKNDFTEMKQLLTFFVFITLSHSRPINVAVLEFKTKNVKSERIVKALHSEVEKVLRGLEYEIKPKKEVSSIIRKEDIQLDECESSCFYNLGRLMSSDLLIICELSKTGNAYILILKIFKVNARSFHKTITVKSKNGSMKLISKLNEKLSINMADESLIKLDNTFLGGGDEGFSKTQISTKAAKESKNTDNSFFKGYN